MIQRTMSQSVQHLKACPMPEFRPVKGSPLPGEGTRKFTCVNCGITVTVEHIIRIPTFEEHDDEQQHHGH
jgi:hypothetical protein